LHAGPLSASPDVVHSIAAGRIACFVLQAAPVHVARGILQAPILEASTFPGDAIYIPDSWFARLRLRSNEHALMA
jgi:hypothetical protein